MQNLINVGDEVKTNWDEAVIVSQVVVGKYGLLVLGKFDNDMSYREYFPYELPPCEETLNWYGWGERSFTTIATGQKLGGVCFWSYDLRPRTIEEYDAEWERTIKEIRQEEPNA